MYVFFQVFQSRPSSDDMHMKVFFLEGKGKDNFWDFGKPFVHVFKSHIWIHCSLHSPDRAMHYYCCIANLPHVSCKAAHWPIFPYPRDPATQKQIWLIFVGPTWENNPIIFKGFSCSWSCYFSPWKQTPNQTPCSKPRLNLVLWACQSRRTQMLCKMTLLCRVRQVHAVWNSKYQHSWSCLLPLCCGQQK